MCHCLLHNGHESEQTLGDGKGQGGLACCSPWDHKELDVTEQQQGPSLVVQWLRLHAPNAGALGSIPAQGTRSHMLQLKNPHVAVKILCATRPSAAK